MYGALWLPMIIGIIGGLFCVKSANRGDWARADFGEKFLGTILGLVVGIFFGCIWMSSGETIVSPNLTNGYVTVELECPIIEKNNEFVKLTRTEDETNELQYVFTYRSEVGFQTITLKSNKVFFLPTTGNETPVLRKWHYTNNSPIARFLYSGRGPTSYTAILPEDYLMTKEYYNIG